MLRCLPTVILAAALFPANAANTQTPAAHWPTSSDIPSRQHLYVVTLSAPTRRQPCTLAAVDATRLTCSRHFGRKPVTFARAGLAAVILPGGRVNPWLSNPICAAFAGGSIYGAVVLSGISIATGVVGGVMAFVVTFDALFYAGELNAEHTADRLLYLKPGERLQVAFRWQSTTP